VGREADKGQKGDRGFSGFAGLKGQKGEPGGRSPSYRVAFSVARSQKLGPVLQASCFMHLNRFLESTLGWCDCDSYILQCFESVHTWLTGRTSRTSISQRCVIWDWDRCVRHGIT